MNIYDFKNKIKQKPKVQSPFVKYCLTIMGCLLVFVVAFTFLLFGTDTLYSVDVSGVNKHPYYNRTDIQTVVDNLNNETTVNSDDANVPGLGLEDSALFDMNVYKVFAGTEYDSRAMEFAALYPYLSTKYSPNVAIGIMANVQHEGEAGRVQAGKSLYNWNGDGLLVKSTASNRQFVSNMNNVAFIRSTYENKNTGDSKGSSSSIGFGMMQWTYYDYLDELATCYETYCSDFSEEDVIGAEMEMIKQYVLDEYGWGSRLEERTSKSCEDIAEYWLVSYEKPANTEAKILERRATATRIRQMLIDGGVLQ